MTLKIALIQMDVTVGRPPENLARARAYLQQAAEAGAQLAVLPELWASGYDLANAERHADPLNDGTFAEMAALAQNHGLYLSGSLLERAEGGFFNTAVLYGPDGALLGHYRKTHLFRLMQEHRYLRAGDATPVFDLPWGPTALAICYDLRFPELFRQFARRGATLVILPAQWPARRVAHWRTLLRARAIENQMVVAACNRVGRDGEDGDPFGGHSLVCDAWGREIMEGDETETLLTAEVDLATVHQARSFIPVFDDRRPDLYG
jgi:predicted amidohydrolase